MTFAHRDAGVAAGDLRPLRGWVLVRIDDRDAMVGSIHVPYVAQGLPNSGEVVRVGAGVVECGPGDRVVIDRHAHADREYLVMGNARHLMVKRDQVISVIE